MAKPGARSVLYRLIEAGQLARRALLVPLKELGLEAGDDAILLLLHEARGATEAEVGEALGLDPPALRRHVSRLQDFDLVVRRATGPAMTPALALTDRGERVRALLDDHWSVLEARLTRDLKKKQRRKLSNWLSRFADLLRP